MSPRSGDPYVITVGAMKSLGTPTRADDLIASYRSKRAKPVRPHGDVRRIPVLPALLRSARDFSSSFRLGESGIQLSFEPGFPF